MQALTVIEAARAAGGRLVVVDAVNEEAASIYRAHDFQPSPEDPTRLIMKLAPSHARSASTGRDVRSFSRLP